MLFLTNLLIEKNRAQCLLYHFSVLDLHFSSMESTLIFIGILGLRNKILFQNCCCLRRCWYLLEWPARFY